jgi:hypothetical protein
MIKALSNATLQAVLLLLVLSFYGWSLVKDVGRLELWRKRQAFIASDDNAYVESSGIAVDGKAISGGTLSGRKHVAFLLRNKSLQDDLNFWTQVNTLLGSRTIIGLIGYCDSQQCVDAIRTLRPLPFPVLAYGEAVSIQAVADADAHGLAIVKVAGAQTRSKIVWRKTGSAPQTVVQEAVR